MGEADGPGDCRRAAEQFSVGEVGEAAKEQADGNHGRDDVAHRERVELVIERIGNDGNHHAQQTAVEGHAPFPDAQDLPRVGDEAFGHIGQHVKKLVAQTPAQNNPQHQPRQDIVDILPVRAAVGVAVGQPAAVHPAADKARKVRKRVPADQQRANGDGDGVYVGEWQAGHLIAQAALFLYL